MFTAKQHIIQQLFMSHICKTYGNNSQYNKIGKADLSKDTSAEFTLLALAVEFSDCFVNIYSSQHTLVDKLITLEDHFTELINILLHVSQLDYIRLNTCCIGKSRKIAKVRLKTNVISSLSCRFFSLLSFLLEIVV